MLQSLILIGTLMFGSSRASANGARLTPDEEKLLLTRGAFKGVTKVEALPKPVLAAFVVLIGDSRLANPGAPFNASDAITDARLPWHRLIFAAASSSLYLIHYEKGGRAHSYYVACFRLRPPEQPSLVWAASAPAGRLRSIAALQNAIESKSLVAWRPLPE